MGIDGWYNRSQKRVYLCICMFVKPYHDRSVGLAGELIERFAPLGVLEA